MKRTLCLLLCLLLLLTGCGGTGETPEPAAEPQETGTAQEAVESEVEPESEPEAEPEVPEEPKEKTVLTMAGLKISGTTIGAIVTEFNKTNPDYTVSLMDYSFGAQTLDQGRMTLNTQLGAGNGPDMICFYDNPYSEESFLSPMAYISHGYLMDLNDLLDQDQDFSRDDILIWKALNQYGGMYLLAPSFTIDTVFGAREVFGDRYGWTIQEYLDLEASLDENQEMMNMMTPEIFLKRIGGRYSRGAVDMENAVCDFDNAEFIAILNAAVSVGLCDESHRASASWKMTAEEIADHDIMASASWIDRPNDLAFDLDFSHGCEMTYIGYPTPDGSCGSDIYLETGVGICTQTDQAEGCWEFLKFMLQYDQWTNWDYGYADALPAYRPLMEQAITVCNEARDNKWPVDDASREALMDLIAACESMAYYDDSILNIILEESDAFFQGMATAEETARRIQDRASLYVMEQYG